MSYTHGKRKPKTNRKDTGSKRPTKGPRRLLKSGAVPESYIQAQILTWLEQSGYLHWRQNSGDIFRYGRKISLGPAGIPDIIVIVPPNGRFLGLEVKSAKGAVRPVQKTFKGKLEAMGGIYEVVRTLAQAQEAVAKAVGLEKFRWTQLQLSQSTNQVFSTLLSV